MNIVTAPFKAIGRLFSGGEKIEEPKVDPVTFAAGSSILSPAMEDHLLRVADFLRRSPFVNLAMTSAPSWADVEELKGEPVTGACVSSRRSVAWTMRPPSPGITGSVSPRSLARRPWSSKLALLREREPMPDALLADLARRRVETTRRRLLEAEGISAARLTGEEASSGSTAPTPAATGEGRVELGIVAGE